MPPDHAPWQGRERRRAPEFSLEELNAHIDLRVMRALQQHEDRVAGRMDKRFDELADLIRSGFPEGDPAAHRRAHESWIGGARSRRETVGWVLRNVVLVVLLALLGYLGLSLWQHTLTLALRDMPALHRPPAPAEGY